MTTVCEMLEACGLEVRDDHRVVRRRGAEQLEAAYERLIARYEEALERQQAEISALKRLLEERDGH